MLGKHLNIVDEFLSFVLSIESIESPVVNEDIVAQHVFGDRESGWITVVASEHVGEDLVLVAEMGGTWPPQEVHALVLFFRSLRLVGLIESAEEHGFETHLREKPCVDVGVAKGVDIPADFGLHAKLLLDPLVAYHHIVNDVVEVRRGFVVGAPTAIDEFELAILNQVFDDLLFFF